MVSEIFHVVALDQYTEKKLSPNTLYLGALLSIISRQQLPVSSIIVRYTLHNIYSRERYNIIHTITS